jgi:hypothetical protein
MKGAAATPAMARRRRIGKGFLHSGRRDFDPNRLRCVDVNMLVLESFFAGRTVGDGVFTNSWTQSERRFHVVIDGTWDGRVLALSEDYAYANGLREQKSWRLQQIAPGVFTGTYDDTIGPASIWSDGPVVRLQYKLKLAGIVLDFDETMTLRDDGSVIDKARVSKWGVPVGRLEVVMRRA